MGRLRRAWGLAVVALAVVACGSGGVGDNPRVDFALPDQAQAGAGVELVGLQFCGPGSDEVAADGVSCAVPVTGTVTFGTTTVSLDATNRWVPGQILLSVPQDAPVGATQVVVTVNGRPSNPTNFDVLP